MPGQNIFAHPFRDDETVFGKFLLIKTSAGHVMSTSDVSDQISMNWLFKIL